MRETACNTQNEPSFSQANGAATYLISHDEAMSDKILRPSSQINIVLTESLMGLNIIR